MSVEALLFDFGGTLDADGIPWVDRFRTAYRHAGGVATDQAFDVAFGESDRMLAEIQGIESFDYTATTKAQARLLGGLLVDGHCMTAAVVERDIIEPAHAIARRNRPVLNDLMRQHRLAIVSNYQGNLVPCLAELGLAEYFTALTDSRVVGVRKPHREIFDRTLRAIDAVADRCWMVGDSPPNDIAAASAIGMRTCWVAPSHRSLPDIAPTARIACLSDLPQALAA